MGTPSHLDQLIRSLYRNQEATVRTLYGDTDWFEIGKGTRQGCILSPAAFQMYAEKVMRNADLEDSSIGVKIGGRNINNHRYADDKTLLAENNKDLEKLILLVKKESENFGLYLNVKKTKIMSTAATTNISIKIDNKEIEVVDDFIFLGSKINRNVSHDIRRGNLHVIIFSVLLLCLGSNVACREYYGIRVPPPVTAIPEADKLIKMSNIRSLIECFSVCMTYSECGMIIYSASDKVCILRKIKQLPGASSFIDIPANSIYTMLQARE
ncbi:Hypothetical predicted protein [Octopus vulgaris]|uniref:Reverse transcriptase domain-containing protein n=1 Tax=Octopus vulgaris TaxID=6645 RepID=A0AA36EXZ9_OCTVU|nr:Hypothetical predicted protein [Octopus vulgaris]